MDKRTRILIVDDHQDILDVFARILESAGYEALKASSGKDCLRLARSETPDLILLDVMIPDVNGIELCRRIKQDPELERICVIHVSGRQTSPTDKAEGLDAGADGYLLKPVDPQVLLAHVRAMIRMKNAEMALAQEREMRSLERYSRPFQTTVSSQMFAVAALSSTYPEIFAELVDRYSDVLDLALEKRAYRVDNNISEAMKTLVERLGFLRAGPRDIVEIHRKALKVKVSGVAPQKARAYLEEGRLRVLEFMGYLASYYRTYAFGSNRIDPTDSGNSGGLQGEMIIE